MHINKTLGILTLLSVLAVMPANAQEDYSLSGDRVAIYNLAGTYQVVAGSGSDVRVSMRRGGRDSQRLTVETKMACGANSLIVMYPDDEIYYDSRNNFSTTTEIRRDGTFFGQRRWYRGERWGCGGGGDRVRISSRGRGMEAWADMTIEVPEGVTIELYLAAGEITATGTRGTLIADVASARVDVDNVQGKVLIDVGSGSVSVRQARGDVLVDTGSGSVRVDDITGDLLLVDTGSGSVDGSDITATEVNIDTGSGRVELVRVSSPDVLVDTGSGGVVLDLLTDVENLEVDTGSGGVEVTLPSDFGARVDIDTGSGGIDIEFPISVTRWERSEVSGTVGDGRGRVMIDTGSGGVRLRRR